MTINIRRTSTVAASLLAVLLGCTNNTTTSKVDPQILNERRAQFVLSDEPAGAVGVEELRAQLSGTSDDAGQSEENESPPTPTLTTEPVQVVLLGRVGGSAGADHPLGSEFPWDAGRAAFVISDPSAITEAASDESQAHAHGQDHADDGNHEHAEHDHDGDHDSSHDDHADHTQDQTEHNHEHGGEDCPCPFCASGKQGPAQAIVQFIGEDGEPIAIDARELFELSGDELIVVKGKAKMTIGMLMVEADKIYVRR